MVVFSHISTNWLALVMLPPCNMVVVAAHWIFVRFQRARSQLQCNIDVTT
eukprot:m.131551 g.131551  ORF g.131551 m.131551 type:complete len:50 (-) comp13917_c0_seq2:26-175(-)